MLAIRTNTMAANAARHLGTSYDALARSVERLASGLRINSARDDAAGMAVREILRAEVGVLKQAGRNARDGISMLQTAEGALGEIDSILVRMKELAEQAATGSYSSDQRTIMNNEYSELSSEITRIAQSTDFNENELLNSTSGVNVHVGSGNITITPQIITATTLSVGTTLATKETHVNSYSVAAADDIYITAADITAGTADLFTFRFGTLATETTAAIVVDLDGYASSGITLNELVDEINDAVETDGTRYAAATALYNSTYASYSLQMSARTAGANRDIAITDTNATAVLVAAEFTESTNGAAGTGNDLTTATGAAAALTAIDAAITIKVTYIAQLGYWMNRLEAAESVLNIQAENLAVAESRISDVDVATEMADFTSTQVLAQAGVAMLAQANAMPQMALSLLR